MLTEKDIKILKKGIIKIVFSEKHINNCRIYVADGYLGKVAFILEKFGYIKNTHFSLYKNNGAPYIYISDVECVESLEKIIYQLDHFNLSQSQQQNKWNSDLKKHEQYVIIATTILLIIITYKI